MFALPRPDKSSSPISIVFTVYVELFILFSRFILGRLIGGQVMFRQTTDDCGSIVNINIKSIIRRTDVTLKYQAVLYGSRFFIFIGRDFLVCFGKKIVYIYI